MAGTLAHVRFLTGLVAAAGLSHAALGQSRVITLNPGGAAAVSNDGTKSFTGSTVFTVGASTLSSATLPGTSPSVTCASSDGQFAAGTVSSAASRWSAATNTWTNCPLVATVTAIGNVRDISANGNFIVGQCTVTGGFGGYVTDFTGPTPVTRKLLGNAGNSARACAVSNDGTVIVGGEAPNTSNGHPGVWRWNPSTSTYDWSLLPDGPGDAIGTPVGHSIDNYIINEAGTIIVGDTFKWESDFSQVHHWLTKWVWDSSTSTWVRNNMYDIDAGTTTLASWWIPTPGCPIPPNIIPTGMTNDGNTIVGKADYQTCGSFYGGGFIYKSGVMYDAYDYLVSQGVDLTTPGYGTYSSAFGGFCHLGIPMDISDDGNHLVGTPYIDPDAPGAWQVDLGTSGGCVSPAISSNPTASTLISACTGTVILNSGAAGSGPFTFEWSKNGTPISAGSTGNGDSTYGLFAGGKQLRIVGPLAQADAGSFTCKATNSCGDATSAAAVLTVDPALVAINNDTCAGADLNVVAMGTNVLGASGTSACAAWTFDTSNGYSCVTTQPRNDRWYKFVPPTTQNYRFDTCGANFDTLLSLFDTCGGSEIACNNDYNTGSSTGCSSQRSRISAQPLTAGVPVYIRIAAPTTASLASTSVMNLSITVAPTLPSNDSCSSPASIFLGATPYNTTEAVPEPFLASLSPCSSSANVSRDLWYLYVVDHAGLLSASTCPQGTAPVGYSLMANTVLSFYDSPCGSVLACSDNHSPVPAGCGSQLSTISNYAVTTGQYIWIRISGNSSTVFGAGQINLSLTCPCTADFDGSGGTPGVEDIDAFFTAWLAGDPTSDADCSGGTPGVEDIDAFFAEWLAGGC